MTRFLFKADSTIVDPRVKKIKQLYQTAKVPPKNVLGRVITYLHNQWKYLIEYIQHPEMPISNILIENQIRPFVLGNKNWLFVGNEQLANQSAILCSLIQSCEINRINASIILP